MFLYRQFIISVFFTTLPCMSINPNDFVKLIHDIKVHQSGKEYAPVLNLSDIAGH